jgi:hypothetical protein
MPSEAASSVGTGSLELPEAGGAVVTVQWVGNKSPMSRIDGTWIGAKDLGRMKDRRSVQAASGLDPGSGMAFEGWVLDCGTQSRALDTICSRA